MIGAKWVMLAGHFEGEVVCEAYSAGAVDYIVKSDFGRMSAIIRDAYHDRSPIRAEVAGYVREEIRRLKALERAYQVDKMKSQLTPTELAILQLIASGHTQKEIAGIMSVAIKTVKNHVNNILRKTGEKSSKRVAEKAKDLNILCCAEDNSVTSVTRFNLKRKSRHYKPGRL